MREANVILCRTVAAVSRSVTNSLVERRAATFIILVGGRGESGVRSWCDIPVGRGRSNVWSE